MATDEGSSGDELDEWELDNPSDPNPDNNNADGTTDSTTSVDPAIQRLIDSAIAAERQAMAKALEEGDVNHPIYKPWQRNLSKKDGELRGTREATARQAAEIQRLTEQNGDIGAGLEFVTKILLDALPADDRKGALEQIQQVRNRRELDSLKARVQNQGRVQAQPQSQGDGLDESTLAIIDAREKEFLTGLREDAVERGLDPEKLSFGNPGDGANERLKAYRASVKEAQDNKDDKRIDRVRPGAFAPTRTPSTTPPSSRESTRDSLEGAIRALRAEEMRKGIR